MTMTTVPQPPVARPSGFRSVHVVTVTHNSASTLAPYLDALAASATSLAGVTIVDNASEDDTVSLLTALAADQPYAVEVIENENSGFAGGYAAAARTALDPTAPVLCLNPDVILAPDAIDAMLDVLNTFGDAGVVTVPLIEADGAPDTASRRKLPTLGGSMVYSVLGRLTPRWLRYNAQEVPEEAPLRTAGGRAVSAIEATTGAVMLVDPAFKRLEEGVFDQDYWMYGEDLQLCADARRAGLRVLIAEVDPSVHVKGVSSGRPRSRRSNRAFHDAMLQYARKNLVANRLALVLLRVAVEGHFVLTEVRALPARRRRRG